jgi:hypothetical protein
VAIDECDAGVPAPDLSFTRCHFFRLPFDAHRCKIASAMNKTVPPTPQNQQKASQPSGGAASNPSLTSIQKDGTFVGARPPLPGRMGHLPSSLPPQHVLYLQRTIGNRAVSTLVQRAQKQPQAAPVPSSAAGGQVTRIQRDYVDPMDIPYDDSVEEDEESTSESDDSTTESSADLGLGYFQPTIASSARRSRRVSTDSIVPSPPSNAYSEGNGSSPPLSSGAYAETTVAAPSRPSTQYADTDFSGEGAPKGKKKAGRRFWKRNKKKREQPKLDTTEESVDESSPESGFYPPSRPSPTGRSVVSYGDSTSGGDLEWGVNSSSRKDKKKKSGKEKKQEQSKKKSNQEDEPLLPDFEDRTLRRFDPDEFVFTVGVYRKVEKDFEFAKARAKIVFRNELRRILRDAKGIGKVFRRFVRDPKENEDIKMKAARQALQEQVKEENLSPEEIETRAKDLAGKSADVGHTWIELTTRYQGRLKTLYSFGMVPAGIQHPDRTTEGEGIGAPKFIDHKISAKAYNRAFSKAEKLYRAQPQYDVKDFNCTKFAQVISQAAGVPFPAKAIVVPFYPKKGLAGLHHKAFMPGGLLEGMKGMKDVRTEATKEERFITDEEKEQEELYNKTLESAKSQPKGITGTGRFKNLKTLEPAYVAGEVVQKPVSKDGTEIGPKSYWRQRANDSLGNLPVKYLSDIELEQHELTFNQDDNLFYWQGKLAHTERMGQVGGFTNAAGRAIYVMTEDGKIYMADQGDEVNLSRDERNNPQWLFHHSSFLHGKPIAAAGELIFAEGHLKGVTDASGHYRPSLLYTRQVLQRFADDNIDLSGVEVTLVEKGAQMPTITVGAKALLDFPGDNESDFRRVGIIKGVTDLIGEGKMDEAHKAMYEVANNYGKQIGAADYAEIGQEFQGAGSLQYAAIWTIRAANTAHDGSYTSEAESIAKSMLGQGSYFEGGRLMQWLYTKTKDLDHALEAAKAAKLEKAFKTAWAWSQLVIDSGASFSLLQQAHSVQDGITNLDLLGTREDMPDYVPYDGETLFKIESGGSY